MHTDTVFSTQSAIPALSRQAEPDADRVREGGVEPPSREALDPKSSAFANSATLAKAPAEHRIF